MKQWIYRSPILVASLLAALSSCGKQSFDVVQSQQDTGAAGSTSIAPKVDILLAVDNSGSTYGVQGALNASIRNFLVGLNSQNWDFRVTAIPLVGTPSISQISASKYDANTASGWVAPYPGAPSTSTIPRSMFVSPENYQVSVNSQSTDGKEPGLANIGTALASSNAQNFFIRKEAILAVVVISNGEDSSDGVDYSSGYPYLPYTNVSTTVLNKIKNAKGSALANSVHLIPVVSNGNRTCYGEAAWNGSRYKMAGAALGGHAPIDLCANTMTSVLTQLKTQLSAIKLNYVKRYIQLAARPNEDTIVITKKLENGSSVNVPKSVGGSAGWLYLGETTAPMVSEPIQMDFRTGYMIQLVGDAYKLTGSESAAVTFLPYGVQPSN
jgi:hypothetical protein